MTTIYDRTTNPTGRARYIAVAVGAGLALAPIGISMVGLSYFTKAITAEYGFRISSFTLYFTLFGLATAATMPIAGRLVRSVQARWLLAVGGVIATTALSLFPLASTLPAFYALGVLLGVGFGLSMSYVPVLIINRWFRAHKGLILGLALTGSGFGAVFLSQLLPRLIATQGWRPGFLWLAGFVLLCTLVPALLLIRDFPEDVGLKPFGASQLTAAEDAFARGQGATAARALRSDSFYGSYAALFVLGAMHAMNQHLANYLGGEKGLSPAQFGNVITIIPIGLIVIKPALGWIIDRLGLMFAHILTLGLAAIATVGFVFADRPYAYVMAMSGLALGFAHGTVTPPLVTSHTFGERDYALLWGTLGTAYSIGLAVGAPVWGLVKDVTGSYNGAFFAVPVITAAVLVALYVCMKGGRALWVGQPTDDGSAATRRNPSGTRPAGA